ncbi:hypothetical protein [Pedobacter sp. UBA5917]|jgi:hypothetical protein|uniref:hypothetical protein n=1 Tax=Pedobacter sp. UBA5917 TaxID=1947061 RepID=UPI0025DC6631|nr:hypothetical protein [Pedobacter sp. UBA5917]
MIVRKEHVLILYPMANQAIQSKDYIRNIDFEYIETYSFQQEAYYSETNRNTGEISWHDQRITDLDEKLNDSSQKISSFHCNDTDAFTLIGILEIDVENLPSWLCAPIYRDAIIFYNAKREMISALNICFECCYMETDKRININADEKTYELLKSVLNSKGHHIR